MSKKQKPTRKPRLAVKSAVVPLTVIHNKEPAPTFVSKTALMAAAPIEGRPAPAQPTAPERQETELPFWAHMPLAVMQFWMAQAAWAVRNRS